MSEESNWEFSVKDVKMSYQRENATNGHEFNQSSNASNRRSSNAAEVISSVINEEIKPCPICSDRVYPLESFLVGSTTYHRNCFRCVKCKNIAGENFVMHNGLIYCKIHYMELFKIRGRYDEDGTAIDILNSSTNNEEVNFDDRPPQDVTKNLLNQFRALEFSSGDQTSARGKQSFVHPHTNSATKINNINNNGDNVDIVRSSNTGSILEDELPAPQTTKNLAAMFKKLEHKEALPPNPTVSEIARRKSREISGSNSNIRLPNKTILNSKPDSNQHFEMNQYSFNSSDAANASFKTDSTVNHRPDGDIVRNEIGEIRDNELPQQGTTKDLLKRFKN